MLKAVSLIKIISICIFVTSLSCQTSTTVDQVFLKKSNYTEYTRVINVAIDFIFAVEHKDKIALERLIANQFIFEAYRESSPKDNEELYLDDIDIADDYQELSKPEAIKFILNPLSKSLGSIRGFNVVPGEGENPWVLYPSFLNSRNPTPYFADVHPKFNQDKNHVLYQIMFQLDTNRFEDLTIGVDILIELKSGIMNISGFSIENDDLYKNLLLYFKK